MAVVNRQGNPVSGGNSGNTQATGAGNVQEKLQTITLEEIKKKGLLGATVELDLEEDAWASNAPPPKGRYNIRLFLGQDGIQFGYDAKDPKNPKENEVYFTCGLQCKVVSDDPNVDGATIFPRVTTRIYRGKAISTMMGLIVKGLGAKAIPKKSLNAAEQVQLFQSFLKKEPVMSVDIDWRGSYQGPDGKWVNALKHYEEFPIDPDDANKRLHEASVTRPDGGVEDVRAQAFVDYWYDKGEETRKQPVKGAIGLVGATGAGGPGKAPLQFVQGPTPSSSGNVSNQQQVVNGPVQQNLPSGGASGSTTEDDMALILGD